MYNRINYHRLNESHSASEGNADMIEKLGEIDVFDEKTGGFIKIKAIDIIKVVVDAQYKIQRDFPYFNLFLEKCKIMYIPTYPSEITDTMAVDDYCNLWINCSYVYNTCKMDSNRVFGILFHELFHIFLDHCVRFNEKYPKKMFDGMPGVYQKANMKANICMDYEVNASMVDDGIVSADFWKRMNCLYKKEYVGKTWEELMDEVGDQEYSEWLSRNGFSLDDVELKILEAVEKAAKVLMDPEADEADKRFARKNLQKTLDQLLGKQDRDDDKSIQDMLEELENTKLGDIGEIAPKMEDLIDDLYKDPAGMSPAELDKTLSDIDDLMDEMAENAGEIDSQFNKDSGSSAKDVEEARKAMKDIMEKMNQGGLSADEKEDLMDKVKDTLEDLISDELTKEKLKQKREERDAKKAEERKERFKKRHPFRKIIVLMQNFLDLRQYFLVCEKTQELLQKVIDEFEPLTELKFSELKKSMFKNLSDILDDLRNSFLDDLMELINDETILNKTEDDMNKLLDYGFDALYDALRKSTDKSIPDEDKSSLVDVAIRKMRMIGKCLKTQKTWRVGEDFKEAYTEEMKRLMEIHKAGGDEALMKELLDLGYINVLFLDEHGEEIYKKITGKSSKFADLFDMLDQLNGGEKAEISDDMVIDGIIDGLRKEGESEEDLEKVRDALNKIAKAGGDDIYSYSDINDDVKPYDGELYYKLIKHEDDMFLELSDMEKGLRDSGYEKFGVKFEKDFPDYRVEETMESVFEVCYKGTMKYVDYDELKKALEDHSDYVEGAW